MRSFRRVTAELSARLRPSRFIAFYHFCKAFLNRPIETQFMRIRKANQGIDDIAYFFFGVLLRLILSLFLLAVKVIYEPRKFAAFFKKPRQNRHRRPILPTILFKPRV